MTEWIQGVKAGLISMPIYGAAFWILTLAAAIIHGVDLSEVTIGIASPYYFPIVSLEGFLWAVFVNGIIRGIIYGLVFAGLYEKLPGKSSLRKGQPLGVVIWATFGFAQAPGGIILNYPLVLFPTFLVGGLPVAMLFGALLGFLWDKFAIKR